MGDFKSPILEHHQLDSPALFGGHNAVVEDGAGLSGGPDFHGNGGGMESYAESQQFPVNEDREADGRVHIGGTDYTPEQGGGGAPGWTPAGHESAYPPGHNSSDVSSAVGREEVHHAATTGEIPAGRDYDQTEARHADITDEGSRRNAAVHNFGKDAAPVSDEFLRAAYPDGKLPE
jgi:hypothetical protein